MANLFGPESKLFGDQSRAEGGGQGAGDNYHGLRPGDIPAWSQRFEYDAGREVLAPDGNYYRCLRDHTASEDFNTDIANWELFGGSGLDTNDQLLKQDRDTIVLSNGSTGGVPIPDSVVDMNDFSYLWSICGLPLTDIAEDDSFVFCRWNGSSYDKYNLPASTLLKAESLRDTLAVGNITGGNDILMTEGDDVVFQYEAFGNYINTKPLTANQNILFPDKSGTIALLSDIPSYETGQTYIPTNVTTNRSFDADSTSLDEVADIVGTLIADLQSVNILS